jgi:hypothetical protein
MNVVAGLINELYGRLGLGRNHYAYFRFGIVPAAESAIPSISKMCTDRTVNGAYSRGTHPSGKHGTKLDGPLVQLPSQAESGTIPSLLHVNGGCSELSLQPEQNQ